MAATSLGRYELLRLLGRGGMAEVFLARRRVAGLEKRLVIKRVRPERAGDATFLELFVREARLSMTLNHQNIVPVFDFGRVGDAAFLAMEHVEGRDLGSTLAKAGAPVPPLLAAFIAAECAQALVHAHGRRAPDGAPLGVVHRDVTPRNVLLSWAGEVKLTDFGVAALAGDPGGKVRGTLAYMAPEQARNEPIDPRADLYALGLVLWELLAGARVRRERAVAALLDEARAGTLPPLPPGPDALLAVVARATQLDPADRYPDAAAMLHELDRYLVAARAAAPGPAPARQLAEWLREVWGDAADATADAAAAADADLGSGPSDLDPATMRSMAETVGVGDDEAEAVEVAAVEAAPLGLPPAAVPAVAVPPRRGRGSVLLVGAAVVALAVVVARFALRSDRGGGAPSTDAAPIADATPVVDATPALIVDAQSVDAAALDAGGGSDARLAAPMVDATPGRRAPLDAGTASAMSTDAGAATASARRKVTIGATPWADFTIDGDPTPHQTPETVELPPGRHTIHFRNDRLGVERAVVIEVPTDRDLRHVEALEAP